VMGLLDLPIGRGSIQRTLVGVVQETIKRDGGIKD
jgi:hypothetical protein